MTLRLRITVRAANEIERASAWWQENRQAAPQAIEDVERTLKILVVQPGIGQRVGNARLVGVRRIHIDRVHHHVLLPRWRTRHPSLLAFAALQAASRLSGAA